MKALNGWQRLWVVASAIWICVIATVATLNWPRGNVAEHHPAFLYQLPADSRSLLSPDGEHDFPSAVEMPNGYVLRFKPDTKPDDLTRISQQYHAITLRAKDEEKRGELVMALSAALVPSLIALALGYAAAWIRAGFMRRPEGSGQ